MSGKDLTPGADAELIRLCDRVKELYATIKALRAEMHRIFKADDGRYTVDFEEARNAEIYPLDDECRELVAEITDLPASSAAGFRSKAEVLKLFLERHEESRHDQGEGALGRSLADDILAAGRA